MADTGKVSAEDFERIKAMQLEAELRAVRRATGIVDEAEEVAEPADGDSAGKAEIAG